LGARQIVPIRKESMMGGQAVSQEEREREFFFSFFLLLLFCANGLYVILGSTFDL
jgi:hypothetical protein